MTKIADDFSAIRRRMAEKNGDAISPDANGGKGVVSTEYVAQPILGRPFWPAIVAYIQAEIKRVVPMVMRDQLRNRNPRRL